MFGYLSAAVAALEEEEQLRYKSCYCGLCRSLKERHGQLSRLTLNYDLTFLVLLLSSLYEPPEQSGSNACIAHPFAPRPWLRNKFSDYAADMNVALAYMKLRDDWDDDCDPTALAASAFLKPACRRVAEQYPRQFELMERSINELSLLEKSEDARPDECATCFGRLMAELFVYEDDRWGDTLRRFGQALGSFIYVMDACIDLEKDAKLCRFNPFAYRLGVEDNRQYFEDILKMYLAECICCFERLPLVQDTNILKNILCIGLWAAFNKKYQPEKGPSDVSGPI